MAPHLGVKYKTGPVSWGLNYSHYGFINSDIKSNTVMLSLDIPFSLYATSHPAHFESFSSSAFNDQNNLSFHPSYLGLIGAINQPKHGTTNTANEVDDDLYGLAGISYGYYLTNRGFAYGLTQGSLHHNVGYQDIFLGGGYDWPLSHRLKALTKLGLGAGGGGSVDTGGGFLIHPQLGLEYRLYHQLGIAINGGYLLAPDSHYHAYTGQLSLKYHFSIAHKGSSGYSAQRYSNFTAPNWRVSVANQLMLSPQRDTNKNSDEDVNLFTAQLDYLLTPHWYLSGQSSYAYTGNAGAYATGMLGVGLQTPKFFMNQLRSFGAIYSSAAGGAGIKTGSGLIIRPELGIDVALTQHTSIRASVGKTFSPDSSGLNSTTFQLGISYQFGALLAN